MGRADHELAGNVAIPTWRANPQDECGHAMHWHVSTAHWDAGLQVKERLCLASCSTKNRSQPYSLWTSFVVDLKHQHIGLIFSHALTQNRQLLFQASSQAWGLFLCLLTQAPSAGTSVELHRTFECRAEVCGQRIREEERASGGAPPESH